MILIAPFTTTETDHKIIPTLIAHSLTFPAPLPPALLSHNIICCLDKYKWNEYEIMFLLSLHRIP